MSRILAAKSREEFNDILSEFLESSDTRTILKTFILSSMASQAPLESLHDAEFIFNVMIKRYELETMKKTSVHCFR